MGKRAGEDGEKDDISNKIDNDLSKNGVNGRAEKFFEGEILLESFEEGFDLPAQTV
jgi:hypothetical protein